MKKELQKLREKQEEINKLQAEVDKKLEVLVAELEAHYTDEELERIGNYIDFSIEIAGVLPNGGLYSREVDFMRKVYRKYLEKKK
jgi:hypothetical protein